MNLKPKYNIAIVALAVLLIAETIQFRWWFFGTLNDLRIWYPTIGLVAWVIKWTFLISTIALILTIIKALIYSNKSSNYGIYISILFSTFIIKEWYPFSFYPMYSNFPNWSYTFYFEDENRNNLKQYMPISHEGLSHLFYSECQRKGIMYGDAVETIDEMNTVGKKMTVASLNMEKIKTDSISTIHLYRIYNHIIENKLISDTTLIATTYVQ